MDWQDCGIHTNHKAVDNNHKANDNSNILCTVLEIFLTEHSHA